MNGKQYYPMGITVAEIALSQYDGTSWPFQRRSLLHQMRRHDLTQRDLAAEMRATESQVSDWLRGRDGRAPSMETRIRMDAALAGLLAWT